jgi:hypothetical protein
MKKTPKNLVVDYGYNFLGFDIFQKDQICSITVETYAIIDQKICRKISKKLLQIAEWMENDK